MTERVDEIAAALDRIERRVATVEARLGEEPEPAERATTTVADRVRDHLRSKGVATRRKLMRRFQGVRSAEMDAITADLVEAGEVWVGTRPTGGRPVTLYRWAGTLAPTVVADRVEGGVAVDRTVDRGEALAALLRSSHALGIGPVRGVAAAQVTLREPLDGTATHDAFVPSEAFGDVLATLGEAIYGPSWQAPLARDAGVAIQTVQRWMANCAMPASAVEKVRTAMTRRRARIDMALPILATLAEAP